MSSVNEGEYTITSDSLNSEGSYTLSFSAVDVTISKQAGEEDDIEHLISGTLNYSMTLNRVVNGEEQLREAEGTIELEGNGKALLRFLGVKKVYRINLQDGDIDDDRDDDDDDDERRR